MDEINSHRSQRYDTQELAELEIFGKSGADRARMKNVSRTGARFEVFNQNSHLKTGDVIQIKIKLNQINKEHRMNGEIIWKKDTTLGVQFISSDKVFEKLKKTTRLT